MGKVHKNLQIPKNDKKFGLGYKLTIVNKMGVANGKREKRMMHLESWEEKDEWILIYNIKQSFQSVGFPFLNQILTIKNKDNTIENVSLLYPCSSDFTLNN